MKRFFWWFFHGDSIVSTGALAMTDGQILSILQTAQQAIQAGVAAQQAEIDAATAEIAAKQAELDAKSASLAHANEALSVLEAEITKLQGGGAV